MSVERAQTLLLAAARESLVDVVVGLEGLPGLAGVNSTAPYIFRPYLGGTNAYEFYNQEGRKFENLIIAADPGELFGLPSVSEPEE